MTGGTPTTLASFNGTNGQEPFGSLTLSAEDQHFMGRPVGGGTNGDGTVFSIPVTGGTPTTLLSFNGTNGADPQRQFDAHWINALWDDLTGRR